MPLSFQAWIEQQSAILRAKYPNFDRWDTTGSPAVVIRVTKGQEKRALFKNVSSSGKYTAVVYDGDQEVYRETYFVTDAPPADDASAATGAGSDADDGPC